MLEPIAFDFGNMTIYVMPEHIVRFRRCEPDSEPGRTRLVCSDEGVQFVDQTVEEVLNKIRQAIDEAEKC